MVNPAEAPGALDLNQAPLPDTSAQPSTGDSEEASPPATKPAESTEVLSRFQAALAGSTAQPRTGDTSIDLFLALLPPLNAEWVENLAVTHWFDAPVAAAVAPSGLELPDPVLQQVRQFPFVREQGDRFAYHDAIRKAVRGYLLREAPARLRSVSARASSALTPTKTGIDDEVARERTYLRLAFDEPAALKELTRLFDEARHGQRLTTCFEFLALADEQRPLLTSAANTHIDFLHAILAFERRDYAAAEQVIQGLEVAQLDSWNAARAGLLRGRLLGAMGRWEAAVQYYTGLLDQAEAGSPSPELLERIHYQLAWAHLRCGELGPAETHALQSLRLNESTHNQLGTALCHTVLGNIAQELRDFGAARRHFEESLQLLDKTGLVYERSSVLARLGRLHREAGELEEARRDYERAIAIRSQAGDTYGLAVLRTDLAKVALLSHDLKGGLQEYDAALQILRQFRDKQRESEVVAAIAEVMYVQGAHSEAVLKQREALESLPGASESRSQMETALARYEQATNRARSKLHKVVRTLGWTITIAFALFFLLGVILALREL